MITRGSRVQGVDTVLRNLNEQIRKIPYKTKKGMIKAGLFIQSEAQRRTPVDTGNLRASAFTVWGPGKGKTQASFKGKNASRMTSDHTKVTSQEGMSLSQSFLHPEVEVGYSAFYAIFVHENIHANHTKLKKKGGKTLVQVGEAKFLEKALTQNRNKILSLIREEADIK